MPVCLVSSIEEPYCANCVRVGDLDADGAPDLLFVQSVHDTREITCLTAATIHGKVLWQVGTPAADRGIACTDLPVQVYDWDHDGLAEVLYVRQAVYAEPIVCRVGKQALRERALRYEGNATLVVLSGQTGREKTSLAIPAPADDAIAFADLTGAGRPGDLVVKDVYWNMWGLARTGETLWHYGTLPDHKPGPDSIARIGDTPWHYGGGSPGHYPAFADIDGDGRDEVFVGYALLDHDGKPVFQKDWGEHPSWGGSHADAVFVARLADGSWRLLFGNGGVHCLAADGVELWHHPLREAQHVFAGRFRADSAFQVAVIDRGYPRDVNGKPAVLYLYDLETGREIWRRPQPPGSWAAAAMPIRWSGAGAREEILVHARGPGRPVAIFDGDGNIVDELDVPPHMCFEYDGGEGVTPGLHLCDRADVYGDSREEVLLMGHNGLRVYANARSFSVPALYNNTYYHGM